MTEFVVRLKGRKFNEDMSELEYSFARGILKIRYLISQDSSASWTIGSSVFLTAQRASETNREKLTSDMNKI